MVVRLRTRVARFEFGSGLGRDGGISVVSVPYISFGNKEGEFHCASNVIPLMRRFLRRRPS
jgi:hypothetical protein